MKTNSLTEALRCCGEYPMFLSLLYVLLGVLFVWFLLTVGMILMLSGITIFLVIVITAYLTSWKRGYKEIEGRVESRLPRPGQKIRRLS